VKIIFVTHIFAQTRHFHTVFEELIARGHRVKVLGLHKPEIWPAALTPPKHAISIEGLEFGLTARPRRGFWGRYAPLIRASRNMLLYAHEEMQTATVFRRRAESFADPYLNRFTPRRGTPNARLVRFYRVAEAATPADSQVMKQIKREAPDIVMCSPLIFNEHISMTEYVKAARRLGIPAVFPVFSWDNLTTKGVMHDLPDRVYVWNDDQRREVVELHGYPPERVEVFGAWRFDDFRDFEPRFTYEEFCKRHQFDPAAPTILYIGSSPIVAATEHEFVANWIDAVRNAGDPTLSGANILIRPHPRNELAWWDAGLATAQQRIAIQRMDELSLFETRDLYEALHHSHAVVGLVTSAMLEAALLKKPVHTIITRDAGEGQEGTVHFKYLTTAGGGLLYVARSLPEHADLIAPHLARERGAPDPKAERFAAAFIEPPGEGPTATERFADAVEKLAAAPKRPHARSFGEVCAAVSLRALIASGALPIGKRLPRRLQA
jgi:hypothetical protein